MPRAKQAGRRAYAGKLSWLAAVSTSRRGRPAGAKKPRPRAKGAVRQVTESDTGAGDVEAGDGSRFDDGSDENPEALMDAKEALRELQSVMGRAGKKDSAGKEFEKKVREEEARLLGILDTEQAERQSETKHFRLQFASLITVALAPPGEGDKNDTDGPDPSAKESKKPPPTIQADSSADKGPLYLTSQAILERSQTLVTQTSKVIDYTSKIKPPPDPTQEWEGDYAEARRIIKLGREASKAEIEELIGYDGGQRKRRGETHAHARAGNRVSRKRMRESDENVQTMLGLGRRESAAGVGGKQTRGWGVTARKLEKGMKALVKALPDESPSAM